MFVSFQSLTMDAIHHTNPGPELGPANSLNARRQLERGFEQLRENLESTGAAIIPFETISSDTRVIVTSTNLAVMRTRSFTEYEVIATAITSEKAAITVICLNCVSPMMVPNMLTVSIAPTT